MKLIPLTQGKFAQVDDEDFEWLSQWKWFFNGNYAVRTVGKKDKRRNLRMHREINKTPDGLDTDHIDMDKLNNQKLNLRSVTRSQNKMNRSAQKNSKSGIKGVFWDKKNKKWRAAIKFGKITKQLGRFSSIEDATNAYNDSALKYHGEFSRINES